MARGWVAFGIGLALVGPVAAADLGPGPVGPPLLDFYGRAVRPDAAGRVGCVAPRRDPGAPATITNAPWDPTYVGSSYGLGRPSRDGFVPGPGFDDPYDRGLRRCG